MKMMHSYPSLSGCLLQKKESYTPNASKGRIVERKGGHRNFNVRL